MSVRRLTLTGLAAFLLSSGGLLLGGAQAWAVSDPYLSSFPVSGFNEDVAVDQATQNVFVADGSGNVVDAFGSEGGSPAGGAPAQLTGSQTPSGSFAFEYGAFGSAVAIDNGAGSPSDGDIYVADIFHDVVDKFRLSGSHEYEYVCEITGYGSGCHPNLMGAEEGTPDPHFEAVPDVAVDSAGDLYVADSEHQTIDEFNAAGENVGAITSPLVGEPGELAVDATGNIYVDSRGSEEVVELKRASLVGGVEPDGERVVAGEAHGIALNPATSYLYVDHVSDVQVYKPTGSGELESIAVLGSEGSAEEVIGFSFGVGVNDSNEEVYVSDRGDEDVKIFRTPRWPRVAGGEISNLQSTSATVSGSVDPEGAAVTDCQVEYGTSTAYGSPGAPCLSLPGSGGTPVPVSANVTGLLPNTLYHYRLEATNAKGTGASLDQTFRTPLVAPAVNDQAASASNVTQFAATLNGTINPGNAPTSYHFAYGPTSAYGSTVPVPDLYTPVNYADDLVTQEVTGLEAGTTYHFALVASSSGGMVTGPDETFTTPSVPAPAVNTGGTLEVTRGTAGVTGSIDPMGWDTSYHFEYGTSTAYGESWPTLDTDMGALNGAQPVTVDIENLQPGTIYHYRLVATNPGGTAYGADQTFTTMEYPASVIQETPELKIPTGVNPESSPSSTTTRTLTRAQKLSDALKACSKGPKRQRAECERQARRRYAVARKKKK